VVTNISTDVLRTLISVVDLRSFTRAAQAQGVSQPAVSAQIKRLQSLLGTELFDRSGPGVSLTPTGELVVNYARRLLSLNDQILNLADPPVSAQTLRIGAPRDCLRPELSRTLAWFRAHWPRVSFSLRGGSIDASIRDLRQGALDIVIALSTEKPAADAFEHWQEEFVWIRGAPIDLDSTQAVPLLAYSEACLCYRVAVDTLERAGRSHDLVLVSESQVCLAGAASAGLGVMAGARNRVMPELSIWDDAPLPALPEVYCGVYLREGGDRKRLEQLAASIATTLRTGRDVASAA
jgi:DNA-binding transcriptional LysR family regulator